MLKNEIVSQPLDTAVLRYLIDVLGVNPRLRPWAGIGKLPYFLQDAFDVLELQMLGRHILLAVDRHAAKPPLATLREQIGKLESLSGYPVAYVAGTLASYERKRLIEQKIPFIVPGNQLYLPDMAIDLREYFRQRPRSRQSDAALSPSTQALLISALLRQPWQPAWKPAEVVAELGYTPMTLSRAVGELVDAGLAKLYTEGKTRWLNMERSAVETWDQARSMMRSPVKRRLWVSHTSSLDAVPHYLAGLSALARYSMLSEPKFPVYAVSQAAWKVAVKEGVKEVPENFPDSREWQLWHYDPALMRNNSETVDVLSLTLSLQDDADERVQIALGGLKEHFPW